MNKNSRIWKIYVRKNIVNNKCYVGQTKQYDWRNRLYQENRPGNKQIISYAISKYGVDKFKDSIIDLAYSQEEADEKEKFWIKFFNSLAPNGYNATLGGQGIGKKILSGTACWNLKTNEKYDSIADLSKAIGATHAHTCQGLNRTNNAILVKGNYIMTDDELKLKFNGDCSKAIKFLDELMAQRKNAILEKNKNNRMLREASEFEKTIPSPSNCDYLENLKFIISNQLWLERYAEYSHVCFDKLNDLFDYFETLEEVLGCVENDKYLKILYLRNFEQLPNTEISKEVGFSPEYCSLLWNNHFPKLVDEYFKMLNMIEKFYNSGQPYKVCNRCGSILPINDLFFSPNKSSWNGYYSLCKGCRSNKAEWNNLYKLALKNSSCDLKKVNLVKNKKEYLGTLPKIKKEIPDGWIVMEECENFAVHKDGLMMNLKTGKILKGFSSTYDGKLYSFKKKDIMKKYFPQ